MYYNVKVKFLTEVTTKKGVTDKITKSEFLIQAETVGDAEKKAYEHLDGTTLDFSISSVAETKIEAVVK